MKLVVSLNNLGLGGTEKAAVRWAWGLAARGHRVTLFEADADIGGQFNLARRVPGKEEFGATLRYFAGRLQATGVELRLSTRVDATTLADGGFDDILGAFQVEE